jgi:aspartyl-tRNA(Asn)/glutamyl-tRNA(Gln) amidotransferase subunit A
MALCWTLDRLGPMCRTADDCGLVLEALAGPDRLDPSSVNGSYGHRDRPRRAGFRFAVVAGGSEGVEPEVAENFEAAVDALRNVGTIEDVDLPTFPYAEVIDTITSAEAFSAFDEFIAAGRTSELDARKAAGHRLASMLIPAHDYIRAQRIRRRIAQAMGTLFEEFDALLAPTVGVVASGLHDDFEYMLPGAFPRPLNFASCLAGLPAISVPVGLGRDGLPTGAMLVGRALGEAEMIDAARVIERELTWREHPGHILEAVAE